MTVTREREMLLEHLDAQRRHVFGILAGLSDEQLRRPLLPSGWHCLGLVKHLALADEHYWFDVSLPVSHGTTSRRSRTATGG